jgi:predicted NBD/HSP70 family sugar kinase
VATLRCHFFILIYKKIPAQVIVVKLTSAHRMRISDQAYNRHRVLKAIRSQGPISRTELTEFTGLSGATITDVTADLVHKGLLVEQRESSRGRGRPRTALSIDPRGGLVIGATLLPNQVLRSSFVDLAGHILHVDETAFGRPSDLAAYAASLSEALRRAIASSPFDTGEIGRIAVAMPGLIDSRLGVLHWLTTYNEPPIAFAQLIADDLTVPVTIENDATCLARAEHWFGQAQALDDFSLFHVDLWVHGAQYVDGVPRLGSNGFNSEMGHIKTDHGPDARTCLCGAKGCLALYASVFGLLLGAGRLNGIDLRRPFDFWGEFEKLVGDAGRGDRAATELFEQAGEHLGAAVADHVNVFDPAVVLVLMSHAAFMELIRPSLLSSVRANVFAPLRERTRVETGTVVEDWRWKGAAAHALEQTFLAGPGGTRPRLTADPSEAAPRSLNKTGK